MSDWDVVAEMPAPEKDPWAIVKEEKAPPPPKPEGGTPVTTGRMLLGEGEMLASGIAGIPHGAAHAAVDLYSRLGLPGSAPVGSPDPSVVRAIEPPTGQAAKDVASAVGALPPVQSLMHGAQSADTALRSASPVASDLLHGALHVGGDVLNLLPGAGAVENIAGRVGKAGAEAAAAGGAGLEAGLRVPQAHPIARTVAGQSGRDALTIHNQQVGNVIAANEAGHAPGQISYEGLASAREPANAVYNRVARALPEGPLDAQAMAQIEAAGAPAGGRITAGSPQAQAHISVLRDQLGNPARPPTGDMIVNELRALRQEGFKNAASEDVSNQSLGKAQLDMAKALEGHIERNLPAGGDVTLDQFQAARQALAKNYTVQSALHGNDVDLQALGRAHRADPELMTGGLKTLADFAEKNPTVTGRASNIYQPPSALDDLIGGERSTIDPRRLAATVGAPAIARRVLTGNTESALERANRMFPPRPAETLAPIPPRPLPPNTVPFEPPPGGATPLSLVEGPPRAPQSSPGGISLADVLSHGVERPSAAPLSLASELGAGGRPGAGIPYRAPVEHMAGDLEVGGAPAEPGFRAPGDVAGVMSSRLPDQLLGKERPAPPRPVTAGAGSVELPPRPGLEASELSLAPENSWFKGAENNGQLGDVLSQGVPEGTMARVPKTSARGTRPSLDFPSGAESPARIKNNASGESAASLEAIGRLDEERRKGVTRSVIDPEGNATPLTGVDAVDAKAPKGHITVLERPGERPEIIDRGGNPKSLAEGLLNRHLAMRQQMNAIPLGQSF